jgi:hypothetical protein
VFRTTTHAKAPAQEVRWSSKEQTACRGPARPACPGRKRPGARLHGGIARRPGLRSWGGCRPHVSRLWRLKSPRDGRRSRRRSAPRGGMRSKRQWDAHHDGRWLIESMAGDTRRYRAAQRSARLPVLRRGKMRLETRDTQFPQQQQGRQMTPREQVSECAVFLRFAPLRFSTWGISPPDAENLAQRLIASRLGRLLV